MSTESTYSAVIPAGSTILRVVEQDGRRSVEVSIPMKEAPSRLVVTKVGAELIASYSRRLDEMYWPKEARTIAEIAEEYESDKGRPLAFTLWQKPDDEAVEGIAAQPQDDVVDAEFDPGAVQQDTPNPERPNPITAEWFKASVGIAPSGDYLDMCNCRMRGSGHGSCGWDYARDMPNFVPGPSKRPDFLLARITHLEGLLHQVKGFLPIDSGMLADIKAALQGEG